MDSTPLALNDKKTETAVIIVNWNGKHLLKDCLPSLAAQSYKNFSVIIVDNASTDGTAEFLRKEFSWVELISLERNTGFTGGNNAGYEFALRNKNIKYISTLNNDTVVHKEWLSSLVKGMKANPLLGSCSSKVIFLHEKDKIDTAGIVIYKDGNAMSRAHKHHPDSEKRSADIFGASAVAALWRRKALEKAGFLDERYFMYQEEVDLGWRVRFAGYSSRFIPKAIVYHAHSASSKSFSPLKAYYSERNRILTAVKDFPLTYLLASPYWAFRRYLSLLRGARAGKGAAGKFLEKSSPSSMAWILLKAWSAGILMVPLMIPARWRIQRMRRKNGITSSTVKGWFEKYGVSPERIALL